MKSKPARVFKPFSLSLILSAGLAGIGASAQSLYWDVNGSTPGSGGPSPTGTWESANWTTDSTGSSPTVDWTEGDLPIFSAGTDATGSYTITVNSTHTIAGLQVQPGSGPVTISGPGTLNIASGVQVFTSTNLALDTVLGGTGGFESASGNVIYLNGVNTYSGGTELNSGQTYFNNGAAFGTGSITPISAGYSALLGYGGSPITLTNNFVISTAGTGLNFAQSPTTPVISTGNWDLQQTLLLRDNGSNTAPLTLSGVVSDVGGLTLSANNSGTVLLSGTNTYSGGTIIQEGSSGLIVQTGSPSALGMGAVSVASGCTLDLDGVTNVSLASLSLSGTGLSNLGAINNSSSVSTASLAAATAVTLGGNTTFGGNLTINGNIGGAFTLTAGGTNILTLNGANTISGVTINYGELAVGSASAIGSGTLNLNDNPATITSATSSAITFPNALTLGASDPSYPPSPGCIFGSPGTGNLTFSGAANSGTANNKTIAANGITVTFSGVISGATTSKFIGWAGGTTTPNSPNLPDPGPGVIILAAANTYTKTNILFSGTVQVGFAEVAGTSGPLGKSASNAVGNIVLDGGILQYSSANHFDYSGRFATASTAPYNTSGELYNIDVNGQQVVFATGLNSAGTGTLTLVDSAGGGRLSLSATNTYTGPTTVSNGVLTLTNNGSISNSSVIALSPGSTFDVSPATSTNFALSSSTVLSASGVGAGSTAAVIKGASGGSVNLGSQAVNLNYTPATFTGDSSHQALAISQGTLALSGNLITVTNAAVTPFGTGTYVLISAPAITGAPATNATVAGTGVAAGLNAAISVSSNNVVLVVSSSVVNYSPPFINQVSLSGTALNLTATNGTPNAQVVLLESTNLAVQTNWTTVATTNFDVNGNLNWTNITVPSTSQAFFILQSP